jgi:hypothetical protein
VSGACGGGPGLLLEEYVVTVTAAYNGKPRLSLLHWLGLLNAAQHLFWFMRLLQKQHLVAVTAAYNGEDTCNRCECCERQCARHCCVDLWVPRSCSCTRGRGPSVLPE